MVTFVRTKVKLDIVRSELLIVYMLAIFFLWLENTNMATFEEQVDDHIQREIARRSEEADKQRDAEKSARQIQNVRSLIFDQFLADALIASYKFNPRTRTAKFVGRTLVSAPQWLLYAHVEREERSIPNSYSPKSGSDHITLIDRVGITVGSDGVLHGFSDTERRPSYGRQFSSPFAKNYETPKSFNFSDPLEIDTDRPIDEELKEFFLPDEEIIVGNSVVLEEQPALIKARSYLLQIVSLGV